MALTRVLIDAGDRQCEPGSAGSRRARDYCRILKAALHTVADVVDVVGVFFAFE